MSSKFQVVKKNEKTIGNKYKETEFKYYKKKGTISKDEVRHLVERLEKKAEDNDIDVKIMVRGLSPYRWTTIKGLNGDIHDDDDYITSGDYSNFDNFYQLQLTVVQKI